MSQSDSKFGTKANIGHSDLYLLLQWFCLISGRVFDVYTSYLIIGIYVRVSFGGHNFSTFHARKLKFGVLLTRIKTINSARIASE